MAVGTPPSATLPTAWVTESDIIGFGFDVAPVQGQLAAATEAATRWLWRRTGRRWPGVAEVTVRPEPDWSSPVLRLQGPVRQVVTVVIDGVTLADAALRLDGQRDLIRVDGTPWPTGPQDWSRAPATARPATEPKSAWSVKYSWGAAPPPDGKRACAVLAYEMALALSGLACRLPSAVTSISRQGESMSFGSLTEMLRAGHTGLWEVDLFTESVNPGNVRRSAVVVRQDVPTRPSDREPWWIQ